ncbi:MAG: hypothetical protein JRN09_04200 [Nitrososphaerota archaeon]|nr:hypothetical protein [Nitrososphaerota archaeon]
MTFWKSKKKRRQEEEREKALRIRQQELEERRKKEAAEEKRWKELESKYGVDRDEIKYQLGDSLEWINPRYPKSQKLTPGHVGAIGLVKINTGKNAAEEPYDQDEVRFKWISEVKYIDGKENGNVFTSGASGAGKSSLERLLLRKMAAQQKVIFSFKANDTHLGIGYPVADVSELPPNPFTDVDAFVSAFAIAFPISSIGITASQVPALLQELARGCSSSKDFDRSLERRIRDTTDRVQLSALFFIQEQMKSIELRKGGGEEGRANLINDAIHSGLDIVLDFSRLSDSAKTFYAELLLRGIWNWMHLPTETSKKKQIIVYVDEAHRLTRGTFEKYHSILNEMAREIRARGALWTSTQNYSDIEDGIRNQFATQFVFNTSSKADLEALRAIDPMLSWLVSGLQKHYFIDAKARFIHEEITVYTCTPAKEERSDDYAHAPKLSRSLVSPSGLTKGTLDEYRKEVEESLENNGVVWVSGLAGTFSEKYGTDKDEAKLRIKDILEKLVNGDEVQRMKCELATGETVVLFFRKCEGENESPLHRWMVQRAIECCNREAVIHVASSGEALPDIELREWFIECETGLKKKTVDLEERIGGLGSVKPFAIVVPNEDVEQRYARFASDRVVLTALKGLSERIRTELSATEDKGDRKHG